MSTGGQTGSYQPTDPSQKIQRNYPRVQERQVINHFEVWIILRGRGEGKVKGAIDLESLEAF